ncbi:MAG: hypothetical protein ABI854_07540 [Betaproteobacteria bacterium]
MADMPRQDLRGRIRVGATRPEVPSAANRLLAGFYLRFHIALILLWSFSAGLLASKAMLWVGINSMLLRYPAALLVSYGAFFLGVRIWLAYVGVAPLAVGRRTSSLVDGAGDGTGFGLPSWRGSGSASSLRGGGGDFGGGGASASFAADSGSLSSAASNTGIAPARAAAWFASSGNGGGKGGGLDFDLGDGDGWLVVLLLIIVATLLSSVFGVVIYLVYSAPAVLADVAFQAMLAGGLIKSAQRWRDACWERSLLRSTWIPFAIVFALAVATAALAVRLFPAAHTLPEVIRAARGHFG